MGTILDGIKKNERIHFIGVGGVSMSALAEILLSKGYSVTGSDINYGNNIKKLEEKGLKFYHGHFAENVAEAAAVIYTVAVHEDNPEIMAAKKSKIPLIQRSKLLGEIMSRYKYSAAISGTHGKTTVTSMLSYIYEKNMLDPTILVGADLDIIAGNLKIGGSEYFIAEACEYHRSFLDFTPYCAAVLNVEPDHLDYYKDAEDYHSAFAEFLDKIVPEGFAVINGMDADLIKLSKNAKCRVLTYGIDGDFDFCIKNVTAGEAGAEYELYFENEYQCKVCLSVYGIHNVLNSAAAIAIAIVLGVNPEKAADALTDFRGADRRLEFKGKLCGAAVYDDYAHHPTEIAATLDSARQLAKGRIICVFQPHTYSRTKAFFDEFASAFESTDEIIYADIYAAREADDGSVSSHMLAEAAQKKGINAHYLGGFDKIAAHLKNEVKDNDTLIIMGAGDIVKLTKELL